MSNEFVNQHIVPKRYLDRFGEKKDKKYIIGTRFVHEDHPKFFTASTTSVGYIKNYYDVSDKSDSKYWEHYFATEIDNHCGRDMENIIAKVFLYKENAVVLSEYDKEILSKVIIAQLMRIPDSVDYVSDILYSKVSKQVKNNFISILPKELINKHKNTIRNTELSRLQRKEATFNHAFKPENFERYCNIIKNNIWVVYVNTQRKYMPYATSDNPVLVEGIGRKEVGIFHNGILNPTTCLFYPLCPSVAVAIYSRDSIFSYLVSELDGKRTYLNDLKYICNRNINIMKNAYMHSFFPQPLFEYIKINQS